MFIAESYSLHSILVLTQTNKTRFSLSMLENKFFHSHGSGFILLHELLGFLLCATGFTLTIPYFAVCLSFKVMFHCALKSILQI